MQKPEFPCLADTVDRLQILGADENLSSKQLGRAIATDPALAAAVIYHATHIRHRHLDNPINNLRQAAMMLGVTTVQDLAKSLPIADKHFSDGPREHYHALMGHAALGGMLGLAVARERRDLEPGEVALASLLFPLGMLALWAVSPTEMETLSNLLGQPGVQAQEAEYIVFGTGIEDAGRTLAEAWKMPELLCRALEPTNALEPRALGVMLAGKVAWHAVSRWNNEGLISDLRLMASYLGLNQSGLADLVDECIEEFNEHCDTYGLAPLPLLKHVPFQEIRPRPPAFCLAPQSDVCARVERRLEAFNRNDAPAILESCIYVLHRGLGLNRVIFARMEQQGEPVPSLIADSVIGTDYEPDFNRFRLRLEGGHLFCRLMAKPTAFWLKGREQKAAWDLLPSEVASLIGTEQFLACSLFVNGTAKGMIYADRRHPACGIDEATFRNFKRICQQTVKALSRDPPLPNPDAQTART
ncbi:hypothetical protein BJI67_12380 [Acidihalobacter aeolianus]|uniref:HDOD domain-containing protein n=1 Tax=Acidihalobacter aeolianus TaxID=2792603 RepID=A0A1D8K9W0_9GAMM|nr:HDOD domain-containing protein [Acidihalobacter aeolianus]AOV17742.1 hypothetical protein BJI67_12380 [Acidihalobacter aeolianus]